MATRTGERCPSRRAGRERKENSSILDGSGRTPPPCTPARFHVTDKRAARRLISSSLTRSTRHPKRPWLSLKRRPSKSPTRRAPSSKRPSSHSGARTTWRRPRDSSSLTRSWSSSCSRASRNSFTAFLSPIFLSMHSLLGRTSLHSSLR